MRSASESLANAYAERLIGSICCECLNHFVILAARHLKQRSQVTLTITCDQERTWRWKNARGFGQWSREDFEDSLLGWLTSHVFKQAEEMIRVARERAETEVFVKRLGFVVFGVNRERTDAVDVRGLQRALHCVLEQAGAEASALPGCCNSEAGEEPHRNGVTSEALRQPFRRGVVFDLAHDERVVAGDGASGESNVGLRRSCLQVLRRIAREKAVERFPAAIEFIDGVAAMQLFNPDWSH